MSKLQLILGWDVGGTKSGVVLGTADGEIIAEVVDQTLVVAETALRYRGEEIFLDTVVRQSEPRVLPVAVTIGIVDGSRVQILTGVKAGTEVQLQ